MTLKWLQNYYSNGTTDICTFTISSSLYVVFDIQVSSRPIDFLHGPYVTTIDFHYFQFQVRF